MSSQGGVLDVVGASRILLRDWSTGRFPRFTLPGPPGAPESADSAFAGVYAADEKIVSTIPTRKERRKAIGVVKLAPSVPEARKIALEVPWVGEEDESDEDDEEEELGNGHTEDDESEDPGDEDEDEEDENEDDEKGEGDDDEDEEEEKPVQPVGKRKRSAQSSAPARPTKKVAFAAEPKSTKQARSAAGVKGALAAKKKAKVTTQVKPSAKSSPAVAPKKVASSKRASGMVNKAANGEEAYDFKKLF